MNTDSGINAVVRRAVRGPDFQNILKQKGNVMANDPYSSCPCGSGKKLKFCCSEYLPDLQRGFRLRENQPEVAVKLFRDLLRKHPDKEVILRELVYTLNELGLRSEARQVVADFLKAHPDQPMALLSMAEICLQEDGFESSRRILHRTFQICARSQPTGVSFLASMIAAEMGQAGCLMAAREHLSLAVRTATGERQRNLVLQLVRFESESSLPFVFRSAYPLLPVNCSDDAMQQDVRARKLSLLGCWEPAAILYNRLADSYPTEGAIWFNLGLCQSWDGRLAESASSLHHAATLLTDFDQAVAAEALAQQIDGQLSTDRYRFYSVSLNVRSASELLSRLESEPLLHRIHSHDHEDCEHPDGTEHAAEMMLLSSAIKGEELKDASQLPESIADVDLYDITDADDAVKAGVHHPFLTITASESIIDTAVVRIRAIAGDLIITSGDEEKKEVVSVEKPECRPFDHRYFCPSGITQKRFRALTRQREPQAIEDWLQLPQPALGGKSALEAANDEAMQVKRAACVIGLMVIAARYDLAPDFGSIRQRLHVPEPAPREIPEHFVMAAIPAIEYERIDAAKLTSTQLHEFTNRCSILGLRHQIRAGLDQLATRPEGIKEYDARRGWLMRAAIARVEEDYELAYQCLDHARAAAAAGTEAFRHQLELDIRELSFRLDDPADPELITLLHRIRDRYLHKIPDIESVIREQLNLAGCGALASELDGGLTSVGAGSSLWTPGAGSESAEAGKLWVPGQE
jgi:tetratricopeptide (TPR) repeat protein